MGETKVEKLYEEYGKLMIQEEVVRNQIKDVRIKIAKALNDNAKVAK